MASIGEDNVISILYGNISICAVEGASRRKTPILVAHALDSRHVLVRECHARKSGAADEHLTIYNRHLVGYCHTRKIGTASERPMLDDRYIITYGDAR